MEQTGGGTRNDIQSQDAESRCAGTCWVGGSQADTIKPSPLPHFGEARVSPPRACASSQTQHLHKCALTALVISDGHHLPPLQKKGFSLCNI